MNRVIDRLKICADAHNLDYEYSPEEYSFWIKGCDVPTLADVRGIIKGFTGSTDAIDASEEWDAIEIFLDEIVLLPEKEIDWAMINLALPYNYSPLTC